MGNTGLGQVVSGHRGSDGCDLADWELGVMVHLYCSGAHVLGSPYDYQVENRREIFRGGWFPTPCDRMSDWGSHNSTAYVESR